jgi:protein involved in polysaccharide export with SLBB domain
MKPAITPQHGRPLTAFTRSLVWLLVSVLAIQPGAVFAQKRSQSKNERQSRSSIDVFSNRSTSGSESQLPLEIESISKAAFDAVVRTGLYVLGPGDVFSVVVDTDQGLVAEEILVGAEGTLVIPYVGAVSIAGMRLAMADKAIADAVSRRFRHLDISINLARLRSFPVNVIGEVESPGAYFVKGVEPVSELIFKAGGLIDETKGRASLRNIEIRTTTPSGGIENIRRADLVLWNLTGDVSHNPFVVDGDQIFVPVKGDSITVSGSVHLPGSYEYAESDHVADLVRLGRGLIGNASGSSAEVLRLEADNVNRIPIDLSAALSGDPNANIALMASDKLYVLGDRPRVTLEGEVRFPGAYPITPGLTLKTLIERAGGLTDLASLRQASLIRRVDYGVEIVEDAKLSRLLTLPRNQLSDGDLAYIAIKTQQVPGRLPVDFVGLFFSGKSSEDIRLEGDDLVRVPRLQPTVLVNGSVAIPAAIPFDPAYTVQDYIDRAGGFADNARRGDVYVIVGSTGNSVRADKVKVAPGDAIFVSARTSGQGWRTFREVLAVAGQVATLVLTIVAINR